jgi:TPR repeat protein
MPPLHSRIFIAGFCLLFATGCTSAVTTDSLKATFDSGVAAYDAGHYEQAYKIWTGIDDLDLAAMRNVALMLRKGQGVAKDPKAAEAMYQRAAEAGLPTAQADLGEMLLNGEAGPPNPAAAVPWLAMAAAANHPIAQFELAGLYEKGEVVPHDLNVARRLYKASASHGMKEAQARLDALGPETPPEPLPHTAAPEPAPAPQPVN